MEKLESIYITSRNANWGSCCQEWNGYHSKFNHRIPIQFRNSTTEPKEVEAGPSNRHWQTHSQQHCLRFFKGRQQMFSGQNDTTWDMHVTHQTALRRQNSCSATRMNAYGMRLNKINWPQEHQYHTVLYIRGNTGTGFKDRKNGARGMWREWSAV